MLQPMNLRAPWVCALCAALIAALLAACDGGGGGGAGTDPQTRQTVGAAGGQVASSDGSLRLSIPAGALAADTQIVVTEVSAANVPAHMQPLGAQRVFRLEPAGLVFAVPAQVSVTLPAGNTLAALVQDSNGRGEAMAQSSQRFTASSRVLGAQMAHFSHVGVVPILSITLDITVINRSVLVGGHLFASVNLSKGEGDSFRAFIPGEIRRGANFSLVTGSSFPIEKLSLFDLNEVFPEGKSRELVSDFTLRCDAPGNANIGLQLYVVDALALRMKKTYGDSSLDGVARVLEILIDVVCSPAGTSFDFVRSGIWFMPLGAIGPDFIFKLFGAWAGLPALGAPRPGISSMQAGERVRTSQVSITGAPRLVITTKQGPMLINPLTGLVDLDLTASGPNGALGTNLFGTLAVSASPPGPTAHAALLGYGQSEFNLLGWDPVAGDFGLNQLFPSHPVLDAQHAGGDTAAQVVILASPTRGVSQVKPNAAGFFAPDPSATISTAQLGGAARSAALPFGSVDPLVLAVMVPTDGAPRNEVVSLTPGASALPVKLFVLPGTPAFAVRCLQYGVLPTLRDGLALCGVTQGDALHVFMLDKNTPAALPVVLKIDSPGALGLAFGLRSNGLPRAVVANFAANNLTVVDFAADGSVAAQRIEPVDAACKKPPHVVLFVHAGKDYVAGTCNESNHYYVRELFSF